MQNIDYIKKLLFIKGEDGTLFIDDDIFSILCDKEFDVEGLCFDRVCIKGHDFSKLKNVKINIQQIPNYDISNTVLNGVIVDGCLDGANIEGTNFDGYIGNLVLNPQTVKDKSLYNTKLNGLIVDGCFDGCIVSGTNFDGCLGNVEINPLLVYEKNLSYTSLNGVKLISNNINVCLDDCELYHTDFRNCKCDGTITLDPQKFNNGCLDDCIFEHIVFVGEFDNICDLCTDFYENDKAQVRGRTKKN